MQTIFDQSWWTGPQSIWGQTFGPKNTTPTQAPGTRPGGYIDPNTGAWTPVSHDRSSYQPEGTSFGSTLSPDYQAALGAINQSTQDFLGFQKGNVDTAVSQGNKALTDIMGIGNANLDPNGPFAQAIRTNINNLTESNLRRAMSQVGAASGARGLGGSQQAGLTQRAATDVLGQKTTAEADIFRTLAGLQTGLDTAKIGAIPGVVGNQMQAITGQQFPVTDYAGLLSQSKDYEAFAAALDQMQQAFASQNAAANPFGEGNLFADLWGLWNKITSQTSGVLPGIPNILGGNF
jgi:hypothetical protein